MRKPREFAEFPVTFDECMKRGMWRAAGKYAVDGDTLDVLIDSGFYTYQYMALRIAAVNTPELRGTTGEEYKRALNAKNFLTILCVDQPLLVRPLMNKSGEIKSLERYVAELYVFPPGMALQRVSDLIINNGHGVAV